MIPDIFSLAVFRKHSGVTPTSKILILPVYGFRILETLGDG